MTLRASDGATYVVAEAGGGGSVSARSPTRGAWETFTLIDRDRPGGGVQSGDHVALRSASGFYVSAELGGGGDVNVNRERIGAWETFQLER